ncbi:MAG TPA: hypothetical protein PLD63_09085 [Ignavibacteria bacterium]|nr:hypothetical protein [Ignavibacteria bacterium]
MKKITLFFLLFAFSFNINAQGNYPKLQNVKSLSSLKFEKKDSPLDKNLEKFNSEIPLNSLSLKKDLTNQSASKPKKFSFSIIPYVWFTSIGGTVGYGPNGEKYGFNKSFSDAVKYLKMAAAVTGKIKYERVSFVYDISYLNLKGFGTEIPVSTPQILSSNWTVKQAIYDLFLAYLFPSTSRTVRVDVYAGGRLWNLDVESTIIDNTSTVAKMGQYTNSWFDPVIGINAEYLLSKDMKWAAWTKGDIGGFGVNSQMTWQMNAGFAYLLSPNVPLSLGFKYVGVNYDKTARNWTVNEYGLTLGIGYRY